jgi:2,3-bisphosphoglycerate-independent phosphoglycerate mutase
MVRLAVRRGAKKVFVHAFLDGRDTPPKSAQSSIDAMEQVFREEGGGRFGSVVGRYFAMDRDHRWPRVKQAYDVITHGKGLHTARSAADALKAAYERGETDEFVLSTAILNERGEATQVEDGDSIIFMNFRSDRARQLTRSFIDTAFDGFDRGRPPVLGTFVTLTEYSEEFKIPVAFPPERLRNVFGAYISQLGLRQLRIAETEKYAHVTFFLNGGVEEPFPGEDRILVPSPNVATYDMKPEMSAPEVADKLVTAIGTGKYDVVICNFANPDMVGHTGNFLATVQAIEALDVCLGIVVEAVQNAGGELIITADHGNAELMRNNETGQSHTAHTLNPVPFLYIGRPAVLAHSGALSDVVPSMLHIMGLPKPPEMGGESLIKLNA